MVQDMVDFVTAPDIRAEVVSTMLLVALVIGLGAGL